MFAARRVRFFLKMAWLAGSVPPLVGGVANASPPEAVAPYALIVGGGPDVESNAAQIEGHTKFVASLIPSASRRIVLFADGKSKEASVTYADTSTEAEAERALDVLLADHDAGEPVLTRVPELGVPLDGPARLADFRRALTKTGAEAAKGSAPLLLYFAGHGTQDEKDEANTHYDLWGDDALKVHVLADELARLPRQVPVVLVMAQCYSGAFADVIFVHGDPKGALADRSIVGFFSAQKDREAAGCSYATGRADYQDFSSYFFGALYGHDRFGDKVDGADYDGDGQVSLHEAFCYALIHDRSADTPVCTSDIFLQKQAPLANEVIYQTPYHDAWQAGTPAQRAVLNALSEQLGLSGENRALTVFDRLTYGDPAASPALLEKQAEGKVRLNATRQPMLQSFFERWPVLRWEEREQKNYQQAFEEAVKALVGDKKSREDLLTADLTRERADEAVDNDEAALQRFAKLYEHIVEARDLREHGKPDIKARFEQLWKSEQGSLLLTGGRE